VSLLFGRQKRVADLAALQLALYGRNRITGKVGSIHVTPDTALRHSAVWACLRLRADLVSTMPIDVYRRVNGAQLEMPKPPVLVSPGGDRMLIQEWMYSTQFDLDRLGNTIGIITERDGQNLPKRIDLVSMDDVTVRGSYSDILEYRIRGKQYDPEHIWHEKQFTVAGLPVGLSPIAYAAWSIGGYLSAQKFANDWFGNGAQHSGVLKNVTKQTLTPEESDVAKTRYREAVADRDIFVTGKDWEFAFANTAGTQASFIEEKQYGISDLARFLGVPGDMIDAATSKGSITYANVTQRNLQLLIMNIGPAIVRREAALSTILPQPRYVKLNTDAILRMDPAAVVTSLAAQIEGRFLAPSEAREIQNRPPFTPEQEAEFDRLFPSRSSSTAPTGGPS